MTQAEKHFRILLGLCGAVVAAVVLLHLGISLWARHEFTQVESIIALHATMLSNGAGLYYALNHYPYTVSPYGPIFYCVLAAAHRVGLPLLLVGRIVSFTALAAELWFAWRILGLLISNRYARLAGLLLAASSCNLLAWGTVAQTDTLACCFSIAAFWQFLHWRTCRNRLSLISSGLLVLLAVFTKQTAAAAGVTIAICLLFENRKTAAKWIAFVGIAGALAVLGLNALTHGHYYEDAVLANMNPMRLWKLLEHVKLFLVTSAGALFVAMAGLKDGLGRLAPLYTYTVLAAAVWLATSPKIGSDSNYQIEAGLLIALCAACALDRFECFPSLFAGSMTGILLLLLPLTVNVYTNLLVCRNTITRRVSRELQHRAKDTEIARFLPPGRGPVLSTDFDPVLQFHGRIDVEPFIYAQLVDAGLVDPTPVLADLQARRFSTVILFRNVFAPRARWENEETVSLTDAQMQAVRTNYRLVGHLKGPYLEGDYIYAPRQ